jgi:hypothetical protein
LEQLHESVIIKRKSPRSVQGAHCRGKFTLERHHMYEPTYLAVLPSAHVFGPNGIVVTVDGGIIEESTWGRGYLNHEPICLACRLPASEKLSGRYFTVAGLGGSGYYHWFADVLPRLEAWEGLHADDVTLIVNTPIDGWKQESLDLLGVGNASILQLGRRHIELELLYFPSYVGAPSPHPAGCEWLRKRLLPAERPDRGTRRIYISRSRARSRRLLNESELVPTLQEYGFETVYAESLSLAEQIRRFSEAEAIVAPHGAGLTNMIWSPPCCRILEIFDSAYMELMYYFFAEILDHRYWYLVGKGAGRQEPQHLTTGFDDILVDRDEFRQAMAALMSAKG